MYWPKVSLKKQEKFSLSDEELKRALRDWAQDSVSRMTERTDALWRFLIGLTALTITSVAYMADKSGFGLWRLAGLIFLGLSILAAVIGNWPLTTSLSSTDDIVKKFRDCVISHRKFTIVWFGAWLLGGIFGFFPFDGGS